MHLLVLRTLILVLINQSTSTPPEGPTKALTTYGNAAKNPVYNKKSHLIMIVKKKQSGYDDSIYF